MSEIKRQNQSPEKTPDTDEKSWDQLFDNIRVLAHRRSKELLEENDDSDAFDRGARSLRTLMSSAEVAARMVRDNHKENETDEVPPDHAIDPVISDEDIRRVKRKLERQIARIDEEDRVDSQRTDAGAGAASEAQTP